jgi:hypothetical protein
MVPFDDSKGARRDVAPTVVDQVRLQAAFGDRPAVIALDEGGGERGYPRYIGLTHPARCMAREAGVAKA